jgi:hypothetical protein
VQWHQVWLWLWFGAGMFAYMAQRAFYGVQGPRPVATGYHDYIYRCWGPLLMRFVVDSGIYWATFSPVMLSAMLHYFGWETFATTVAGVTQYGFFALFFGLGVDVAVDFGVTKIPVLRDNWPQMPPPLPQKAVVEAQIVQQTVTQLQSTTTVIPKEAEK